jgi:hypothetical protein
MASLKFVRLHEGPCFFVARDGHKQRRMTASFL